MLTIVIPTRNRSPFLGRLLGYYADLNCAYPIMIGDASDEDHLGRTRLVIARLSSKLRISHHVYPSHQGYQPGQGTIECLSDLLKRVETKYTVCVADDDFVVPRCLTEAVQFLELHPDYSAVHGAAAIFTIASDGAYGEIYKVSRYMQRTIEEPSASGRLLSNMQDYSACEFSLKWTERMSEDWRSVRDLELDNLFGELMVSCLTAIAGKIGKLNGLYMVRQAHAKQTYVRSVDVFDWVTSAAFSACYQRFCDLVVHALACKDRIAIDDARVVVKQAFWSFLAQVMMRKWQQRYFPEGRDDIRIRLRGAARRIPGLRRTWHKVRSFVPGEENEMLLPALLRPSSSYHADFMPIYRAITIQPEVELP